MQYTVQKLATHAGVTVRTLHHYDAIGLLKPQIHPTNGYRLYGELEVRRLQQILFFRELEFTLEDIKRIMDAPHYDAVQALKDQRELLLLKKKRIDSLVKTIDETISRGGESMKTTDFSAFSDPTYVKHKEEAKARWGHTDAYKQSMERVGKMSKAELEAVTSEGETISQTTAELMLAGFTFDSPEVQTQIELFYNHLRRFYEPSYELFRGLGQMYVDDPRFTEVYDKRADGFAIFMRDAMAYYVDVHTS